MQLCAPRCLRVCSDRAFHLHDRFGHEPGGLVEDDLCKSGAVAEDEKRHASERTLPVQPAAQQNSLAGVRRKLRRQDPFHLRHLPSTTRLGVRAGGESRGATALRCLALGENLGNAASLSARYGGLPTAREASLSVLAVSEG